MTNSGDSKTVVAVSIRTELLDRDANFPWEVLELRLLLQGTREYVTGPARSDPLFNLDLLSRYVEMSQLG